jgi:adenosylcobinamide-GDP ribazoletransferase
MKDSRIGSYGAVGLIFAIGLRGALMLVALENLEPAMAAAAIVAASTFGRLAVVALMVLVAPAPGGSGLAKDVGSGVGVRALLFALVTAIPGVLALAMLGPMSLLWALGAASLFLVWFRRLLIRRIGGSTGDCLGFAAYAGQLILLMAATAG